MTDAQKNALLSLFSGNRYKDFVDAGNDAQVAALANEKTHSAIIPIKPSLVKKVCLLQGVYPVIYANQQNSNAQIAGLCLSAIALLNGSDEILFDPSYPAVRAMLTALKDATLLSQANLDAINAEATVPISDVENLMDNSTPPIRLFGVPYTLSVDDVSALYHESRVAAYNAMQVAIHNKAQELKADFPEVPEIELLERADNILHGATWGENSWGNE